MSLVAAVEKLRASLASPARLSDLKVSASRRAPATRTSWWQRPWPMAAPPTNPVAPTAEDLKALVRKIA